MENRIINIETRLDSLDTKVQKILDILENNVSKNCEKMDNHIQFIESVYDNVKHPLQFICNRFYLLKSENNKLEN